MNIRKFLRRFDWRGPWPEDAPAPIWPEQKRSLAELNTLSGFEYIPIIYDTGKSRMAKPELMTSIAAVAAWDAAKEAQSPMAAYAAGDAMARILRASTAPTIRKATLTTVPRFTTDLKAALALLGSVIEPRNTIPILGCVLLKAEGNVLRLSGTNLDHEVNILINAPDIGKWEAAPTFRDLNQLIGKTKAVVTLNPVEDGLGLLVTVGGVKGTISGYKPADMPVMEAFDKPTWAAVPTAALDATLRFTDCAISTEETRYYLNGAYFHFVEEEGVPKLRIVTTDGHRLMLDQFFAPIRDAKDSIPMIVPRLTLKTLSAALSWGDTVRITTRNAISKDNGVELSPPCISHVRFDVGQASITSKVIDGQFPDYTRVMPTPGDKTFTFNRSVMNEALLNVLKISREKSKAVRFTFGFGSVKLFCRNMDGGQAHDTVDITAQLEARPIVEGGEPKTPTLPIELGLNGKYLAESLSAFGSAITVDLNVTDAASPMRLTDPATPNRQCILMPLRV